MSKTSEINATPAFGSRAAELRQAFDRSFALPPPQAVQEPEDLLAIRVAGDLYAIRIAEIVGIVAGRTVTPIPAAASHLLGLAAIRGEIVPVFGLASILGYRLALDSPRWMILCAGEETIALAFADFEGYLRLPKFAVYVDENPGNTRRHVSHVARTAQGVRAVISVPLVLADIQNQVGPHRSAKEQ
jgi:chemotaxis signal transduction protein